MRHRRGRGWIFRKKQYFCAEKQETRHADAGTGKRVKRPRLRLPFEKRKQDAGSWTYDHRIGLCVTLIAYLVLMIAFVSSKIVVGRKPHTQGMYIDLQTLAELEQERDRLERLARERQEQDPIDWRSIQNQVSNENALNEKLRDDRGTNAAALNDAAAAAEERMRANREAYEQGLAEERAIRQRRGAGEDSEHQDRKVKGRVTVSFSLTDPVRTSRYLAVPAYKCEGGGEVVVEITVNRAGDVTNARVVEGGDECMRSSALGSARRSRFNIDDSAPARQQGTITYILSPNKFFLPRRGVMFAGFFLSLLPIEIQACVKSRSYCRACCVACSTKRAAGGFLRPLRSMPPSRFRSTALPTTNGVASASTMPT